jgi:O-methyltransferase
MKAAIRSAFPRTYDALATARATVARLADGAAVYAQDGMKLYGKSLDFLSDPRFVEAYRAGMDTGHHICRERGSDADIHNEYRVYLCCWAAESGARLDGDFVECGVNTGITSVAICRYLDFNRLRRRFFLFDTFAGIPIEQASDEEREARADESARFYEECFELASQNFAPWPGCTLVRGRIPETLGHHTIDRVAYLHLDMNIAAPEIAAIDHFWPRLVPGAIVLLDDYGYEQYRPQKNAMDAWCGAHGVPIVTLPTGQGMMVKA